VSGASTHYVRYKWVRQQRDLRIEFEHRYNVNGYKFGVRTSAGFTRFFRLVSLQELRLKVDVVALARNCEKKSQFRSFFSVFLWSTNE
jgi:hypothetical protein